jgi:C4-dicarboxylate transporter DctM subunit
MAIWFYVPTVPTSPEYVFQSLFTSLDAYVLLAVPLFILSGQIMARGGMATRLFDFFIYFIGGFRGGLPCTVIVTCLFYGALSGAGAATVAAVGAMTIPVMVKLGFDKVFVTALVAVSGGLGVIIPPSIPFVMYGVATGASVGDLFIAGIIPGCLIAVCLCAYAIYYSRKHGEDREKINEVVAQLKTKGFLGVLKESALALFCPVIILGGIYGGIFTPTEAAGVSVFYGIVVSLFVYRTIPFRNIPRVLFASLHSFGPQFYIVGCCTVFARALTLIQATSQLTAWMKETFVTTIAIILAINVLLLVLGCFMDTIAAVLIAAPILWPIAEAAGFDIVHFGIVMVVNLAIGFVTPPVGANLFVAQGLTGIPIMSIAKKAVPFIISFLVALVFITFVPQISLVLL